MISKKISKLFLVIGLIAIFTACKGEEEPSIEPIIEGETTFVIGYDAGKESFFTSIENIESGELSLENRGTLTQDATLYLFDNKKAYSFEYRKGDPSGMQSWKLDQDGNIENIITGVLPTREEAIAKFGDKMLVMTSITFQEKGKDVKGQAFIMIDGKTDEIAAPIYLNTENLLHEGEYCNFAGIISLGDKFISAAEPYNIPKNEKDNTTTAFPDEANFVVFDKEGKITKKIHTDKISQAIGRKRSSRMSCLATDANGDIYAFSPSRLRVTSAKGVSPVTTERESKLASGVIKINKATLEVDKNYYFDIEKQSGDHHIQNVFSANGDYVLLNMYANPGEAWNGAAANRFAIFNVKSGDFNWIKGLPEGIDGHSPRPYMADGKIYFGLTASAQTAIYIIDPATATAKKGLSITDTGVSISSIAKMSK